MMTSLAGTKADNPPMEVLAQSQPLNTKVLEGPGDVVPAGGLVKGDVRPNLPHRANQGLFDPSHTDGDVPDEPMGMVDSDLID